MAFTASAGYTQHSGGFIPEIWSAKLLEHFYERTVLGEIANTEFEGEITDQGDKVHIRHDPEITIRDYEKGQSLTLESPAAPTVELNIDEGHYFAAKVDDVDKYQSDLAMMDRWSADGAERMKIKCDSRVLANVYSAAHADNAGASAGAISGSIDLGASGAPVQITKSNVLDKIVELGTVLDEQNIPNEGRWLVLPAWMCGLIKRSDLKDASLAGDNTSIMRNGRMGMIDRFTLYLSNLIDTGSDNGNTVYNVIAGHPRALTFAGAFTNMEQIRSENFFGNIVRGLKVYGYKTVQPEAMAHLYCYQ